MKEGRFLLRWRLGCGMPSVRFQSSFREGLRRPFCQAAAQPQPCSCSCSVSQQATVGDVAGEASDAKGRRGSMAAVPFPSLISDGILYAFRRSKREGGIGRSGMEEGRFLQGLVLLRWRLGCGMPSMRFQSSFPEGLRRSFCQAAAEPQACSCSMSQRATVGDVAGEASDAKGRRGSMAAMPFPSLISDGILCAFRRSKREGGIGRSGREHLDEVLRKQGLIPAVLTDQECVARMERDLLLSLRKYDVVRLVKELGKRDFLSRTFDLKIFSSPSSNDLQESLKVLPRNLNYGDGKTNILNIQLLRVPSDGMLRLGVRLEYLREHSCPGIRKGGILIKHAKYVLYHCRPCQLPSKIVVDLSVLEIGDRVLLKHLEVDKELLDVNECTLVCEIKKSAKTVPNRRRSYRFVKCLKGRSSKQVADAPCMASVAARKTKKIKMYMGR